MTPPRGVGRASVASVNGHRCGDKSGAARGRSGQIAVWPSSGGAGRGQAALIDGALTAFSDKVPRSGACHTWPHEQRRRYGRNQLVGPRNSRPAPKVAKAVDTFLEEINNRVRVATMVGAID